MLKINVDNTCKNCPRLDPVKSQTESEVGELRITLGCKYIHECRAFRAALPSISDDDYIKWLKTDEGMSYIYRKYSEARPGI